MSKHLESDAAMRLAGSLLAVVAPCLREEEQAECRAEFLEILRAALKEFGEKLLREARRLGRPPG